MATSGYVAVPRGRAPTGGWPVITWGHGTTGIADKCAPTRYRNPDDRQTNDPLLERWISEGYAVVRTDYEGLGTPGEHPYLIGAPEGRAMLDAVRAARRAVPHLGTRVLIAGHSQGGHAALWAASLAPHYTPELRVRGTLAFAPQSHTAIELPIFRNLSTTQTTGPAATILRGLDIAYRSFDARHILTPAGAALYPQTLTRCSAHLTDSDSFGGLPTNQLIDPGASLNLVQYLAEQNDPETLRIRKPVRLEQGLADSTVPAAFDQDLSHSLAASGATVTYRTYEGATHATVVAAAADDATAFVNRRFGPSPR